MPTSAISCRTCRSRLKHPAEMRMAAFCGPICFSKYYAVRCRVCDRRIKPAKLKSGNNAIQTCGRLHRLEYQRERSLFQFLGRQKPLKQADVAKGGFTADHPLENPYRMASFSSVISPQQVAVDHSDVEALRITILRRDKYLDTPVMVMCARLDRQIAAGGLQWQEFKRMAKVIKEMPPALPLAVRLAEQALSIGMPLPIVDEPEREKPSWRNLANRDIRDIRGPARGTEIEMPDMPQFMMR